MGTEQRPWVPIVRVCVILALASLASNVALRPEMEGDWQTWSFLRKSVSKVLNAGSVWAAVALYAGWHLRKPGAAVLAGVAATEGTLVLHYALGTLLGMYDSSIWSSNISWFIAGVVLCAPLGLCGWLARRTDLLGLVARLLVPAGALAEPWVRGMFSTPAIMPWPERWSSAVCGVVLMIVGVASAVIILRRARHRSGQDHSHTSRPDTALG